MEHYHFHFDINKLNPVTVFKLVTTNTTIILDKVFTLFSTAVLYVFKHEVFVTLCRQTVKHNVAGEPRWRNVAGDSGADSRAGDQRGCLHWERAENFFQQHFQALLQAVARFWQAQLPLHLHPFLLQSQLIRVSKFFCFSFRVITQ